MGKVYKDTKQFIKDNKELFVKPDLVAIVNRLHEAYPDARIDLEDSCSGIYIAITSPGQDVGKRYWIIPELQFQDGYFIWVLKERYSKDNNKIIGEQIAVDLYGFKQNEQTYYVSLEDYHQLMDLFTDIETWKTRINIILGIG